MAVLNWLEKTSYAEWVNQSWGWPLALTIHAFGTATVVGLTFIIGLRLFGLFVTCYFQITMKREAASWEANGAVSSRGRKLVSATCLLWAAVTIGGRLTAYLGSLYLG